jgi:hypothetical protein
VTFPFAFLALLIAVLLVIVAFRDPREVPSFAQMGGQDRIRTAAEVSRFWPKKAIAVVIAPSKMQNASQMLAAGMYAAKRDAPLLFISNPSKLPKTVKAVRRERPGTCIDVLGETFIPPLPKELRQLDQLCPIVNPNPQVSLISVDAPSPLAIETRIPSVGGLEVIDKPAFGNCYLEEVCLPERLVFATQDKRDLPDMAVAIALAAHLDGGINRGEADRRTAVVAIPRRLEANAALEELLRKRSSRVREALLVGGSDVMTADLQTHLRATITPPNPKGKWEAVLAGVDRTLEAVLPITIILGLLAAAKSTTNKGRRLIESGTVGRIWNRLRGRKTEPSEPVPPKQGEQGPGDQLEQLASNGLWEEVFAHYDLPVRVRVTLRNGRTVEGMHSTSPQMQSGSDLYLSLRPSGNQSRHSRSSDNRRVPSHYGYDEPRITPQAIWLSRSDIVSIEFFDWITKGR